MDSQGAGGDGGGDLTPCQKPQYVEQHVGGQMPQSTTRPQSWMPGHEETLFDLCGYTSPVCWGGRRAGGAIAQPPAVAGMVGIPAVRTCAVCAV